MSTLIKCDGNDNCQNIDDGVYPLSEEVRRKFTSFKDVEHLCENCMEEELNDEGDLVEVDKEMHIIKVKGN